MQASIPIALVALAVTVLAAPQDVTTTTLSATLTVSLTSTTIATVLPTQTTTISSSPTPTHYSAYVVSAYQPDSPIHLLPLNAAGLKFWLGGNPSAYCPTSVQETGNCPEGKVTGFFNGCALSAEVPGGQSLYAASDGSIGYTQAHSIYIPNGSVQCPIGFSSNENGYLYDVLVSAFGSHGLMACPNNSTASSLQWQVFVALQNATVPNGDVSNCIKFSGIAFKYDLGIQPAAAWQYA